MAEYTIYEKMILLTIANAKKCTHDEIASMSGCSKRYVADRIKDLASRGVIEVNKEERPHAYAVHDDKFNEICTAYNNVLEYDDLDSYENHINCFK